MTEYRYIYLKCKEDLSKDIEFYFYYYNRTTIEDWLEYIIYNYPEKNFCFCFELIYKKEVLDLNTNLYEKFSKSNSNINLKISNKNGNGCNCDKIFQDNIKKSRKEIIELLIEKENKIKQLETDVQNKQQKIGELENNLNDKQKKENKIKQLETDVQTKQQKISELENNLKEEKKN